MANTYSGSGSFGAAPSMPQQGELWMSEADESSLTGAAKGIQNGLALPKRPDELVPGLTPDLEKALIGLTLQFEEESYPTWRFL